MQCFCAKNGCPCSNCFPGSNANVRILLPTVAASHISFKHHRISQPYNPLLLGQTSSTLHQLHLHPSLFLHCEPTSLPTPAPSTISAAPAQSTPAASSTLLVTTIITQSLIPTVLKLDPSSTSTYMYLPSHPTVVPTPQHVSKEA